MVWALSFCDDIHICATICTTVGTSMTISRYSSVYLQHALWNETGVNFN
jgi:hypothetical protein